MLRFWGRINIEFGLLASSSHILPDEQALALAATSEEDERTRSANR